MTSRYRSAEPAAALRALLRPGLISIADRRRNFGRPAAREALPAPGRRVRACRAGRPPGGLGRSRRLTRGPGRDARKSLFWLAAAGLLALVVAGCGPGAPFAGRPAGPGGEIIVFAASSLTDAFRELATEFEQQNPGWQVLLNFAGSSQLAAQLQAGARADVYASANPAQLQVALDAGRIRPGTEKVFASNRLMLIVPQDNPAAIAAIEDLNRPELKIILAVPGVPVRAYTDALIAAMDAEFQRGFYANVVSEEQNVRQVAAKVALGEADAGIVYRSDVTPDLAPRLSQIEIPAQQNIPATYLIAALADSAQPEAAERFIDFVLSGAGQSVLRRWGFGTPAEN